MQTSTHNDLILIRHAPVIADGCVYGRRDLPADCSDTAAFSALRHILPPPSRVVCSPALRCTQTAKTLWPHCNPIPNAALWEQDFGQWEGMDYKDVPDLGPLSREALSQHRPPRGESFVDLCARTAPALRALAQSGRTCVIAHAGTIRAALAMALGSVPAALAFDIAPLSVTRLSQLPDGAFVILSVAQPAQTTPS